MNTLSQRVAIQATLNNVPLTNKEWEQRILSTLFIKTMSDLEAFCNAPTDMQIMLATAYASGKGKTLEYVTGVCDAVLARHGKKSPLKAENVVFYQMANSNASCGVRIKGTKKIHWCDMATVQFLMQFNSLDDLVAKTNEPIEYKKGDSATW